MSLVWHGSPVGSQCLKVTWSTSQRTKVLGQLPPVAADRPDRRESNNRELQPIPSHCTVSVPTSCALTTTFLLLSQPCNLYWQIDKLWNTLQLFCSCHSYATNTDRLTNYGTTHLPCKWYWQGYLCHTTLHLSSLSWYQCLQMQASCLTDHYYYCTGRKSWMEILERGPWENSNSKVYATVVFTITSAKTHNLFRLPVQLNCLLTRLKELKKLNQKN